MGTYTKNYNFYIPEGSELGLIVKLVLEPNFTITDQQLKNLDDKKIDKVNIVNNLTTTSDGTVLDGRQGKILDDKKFDKTGGTITKNVVVQEDLLVNGTVSTNAFILGGYTIVIE